MRTHSSIFCFLNIKFERLVGPLDETVIISEHKYTTSSTASFEQKNIPGRIRLPSDCLTCIAVKVPLTIKCDVINTISPGVHSCNVLTFSFVLLNQKNCDSYR